MGSQESKIEVPPKNEPDIKDSVLGDSAPSTPILTPLDPRSPSVNIARTPLELILGEKADEVETEEQTEETKDVVNVILGMDPRSPTVEFTRTPIIVGAITKGKSKKLQNKNFDNVLKSEIHTTPVNTNHKNIVPPKYLGCSPVTIVSNHHNKRKSFVGLLETNIDFTETDLDTVCQKNDTFNKSLPLEIDADLPCNKLKDQMEALQIDPPTFELIPEECNEELKTEKEELACEKAEEEKVMNVTAQVKDFDKKLTNLIYQDDSDDDNKLSLKSSKIKEKENNRTPLAIRNSNEDTKKLQSRLKVSDKPRKHEISRIPILKDQAKKVGVQCENTPPLQMEGSKLKGRVSRWDAEKTLII